MSNFQQNYLRRPIFPYFLPYNIPILPERHLTSDVTSTGMQALSHLITGKSYQSAKLSPAVYLAAAVMLDMNNF